MGVGSGGGGGGGSGSSSRLTRALELLFADENMRFDRELSKGLDEHGYCDASALAKHGKVQPHVAAGREASSVSDSAGNSSVLECIWRGDRALVRRRRPYKAAELPPVGTAGSGLAGSVQQGAKDVHDGKNFRQFGAATVFAPGHKTAMGQKGAATDDDLQEKKRAKNERKQIQAEREEMNRKKRARENGDHSVPAAKLAKPGGGGKGGEEARKPQREKKPEKTEEEKSKALFRHKINLCCKNNEFEKAMVAVQEMKAAGFSPDAQVLPRALLVWFLTLWSIYFLLF
jgi:pentatricopeptide repeat protein